MAVYAPTPPTPPSPPTPPRIVLGEGGSVRESTVPQSFTGKSDAEINEDAARSAVAHGAGKMTKTTVERPDNTGKTKTAGKEQTNVGTDKAATVKETETAAPRTAVTAVPAATQDQLVTDPQVKEKQRQMVKEAREAFNQETTSAAALSNAPEGHGPVYWTFSIVSLLILAGVALYVLLNRRSPTVTASSAVATPTATENTTGTTANSVHIADRIPAAPPPARPVRNPRNKEAERFEVRI